MKEIKWEVRQIPNLKAFGLYYGEKLVMISQHKGSLEVISGTLVRFPSVYAFEGELG